MSLHKVDAKTEKKLKKTLQREFDCPVLDNNLVLFARLHLRKIPYGFAT